MSEACEVRFSTAVMAHPRRREEAERLRDAYPELNVTVVFDPDPNGPPATLRTARLAWAAVADDATHHLVLQDDVLLCRDFPAAVRQALCRAPEGALALFAAWSMATAQAMRLAALAGASWTPVVDDWTPTQALVLPAQQARDFAEHARELPDNRPDNRAMATFLAERGLTTYVSIPNLVEHAHSSSLLANDLLHGVRSSTAFAGDQTFESPLFLGTVVRPPALSYMWLGAGEFFSCYDPLQRDGQSIVTPTHEVLGQFGLSGDELAAAFGRDQGQHPELRDQSLLGDCFHFSLWLTMFASGVIAGSLLDPPYPVALKSGLDQPWAQVAMRTFPAAALRKMAPAGRLRDLGDLLTPFCRTALGSGLAALENSPDLTALWEPGKFDIRPNWARG